MEPTKKVDPYNGDMINSLDWGDRGYHWSATFRCQLGLQVGENKENRIWTLGLEKVG